MCWNSDKCISLGFTFFFYRFKCKIYICREGFSFVIQCSYFTDKITFLGRYFILQYCFISVLHNSILNCICGDVPESVCPLVLVAHIAASFLFRIHWEIHFHLIKKRVTSFLGLLINNTFLFNQGFDMFLINLAGDFFHW